VIARVLLPHEWRDRLCAEARAAAPRECCGLIEGVREGETVRVTALHPTRNLAERADRFEIDPGEHIRLLRILRGSGHELVGCYHSHPGGKAEPSEVDRAGANEENFLWLIAGIGDAGDEVGLAAFVFDHGGFTAIAILS
jgi:proteasome lid subunit RPN8/RPN11